MHDLTEVDHPDARPQPSGLAFVGLLIGALLAAMLFGQITDPERSHLPSTAGPTAVAPTAGPEPASTPRSGNAIGVESIRQCPVPLGGLALDEHSQVHGWAFERWDCDALDGPWSVVIRATGGSFGVRGAVVTFPVDRLGSGIPVTKPESGRWNPSVRRLVWPLARAHAQIVGDLGQSALADLATQITVEHGKPRAPSLDGFSAAAAVPYNPPLVHEMRYSTDDLRQAGDLGIGLVYAGATSGASFESQAFEANAKPAGSVRGKPAIFAAMRDGDWTLSWESAPGRVAYIGFTGSTPRAETIEALRALADKARPLTPAQWLTKDRIPVGRQSG